MVDTDTHETSLELNATGREVEIDTGFYSISVRGDPEDELKDVKLAAFEVALKAREHVRDLDDNFNEAENREYE